MYHHWGCISIFWVVYVVAIILGFFSYFDNMLHMWKWLNTQVSYRPILYDIRVRLEFLKTSRNFHSTALLYIGFVSLGLFQLQMAYIMNKRGEIGHYRSKKSIPTYSNSIYRVKNRRGWEFAITLEKKVCSNLF